MMSLGVHFISCSVMQLFCCLCQSLCSTELKLKQTFVSFETTAIDIVLFHFYFSCGDMLHHVFGSSFITYSSL